MEDIFLDELRLNETDIEGALNRLSGDQNLYASILQAFPLDPTMGELEEALQNKEWDDAFTAAHALKGLAGNLGFTPLFHSLAELVIAIRSGRLESIDETLRAVRRYYDDIVIIISHNNLDTNGGEADEQ